MIFYPKSKDTEVSRTEYSVRNTAANMAALALNYLAAYACRIVFVREMETVYLGISGLFSNILSMLSLAELGIGAAIGYALYKPVSIHDEDKISALMAFYAKAYRIIGVIVALIGLSMMPFLNLIIREPPAIKENLYVLYSIYLFNTTISYFYSYKGTLLFVSQRNYVIQGINCSIIFIQNAVQILILLLTHQFYLYLSVQTVCVVLNNLLIAKAVDKRFPFLLSNKNLTLEKAEKKKLFINIKALTLRNVGRILVNNTDNIAITYFLGLITTGVASNYALLCSTLSTVCSQLFSGLTASVGNLNALENEEKKYSFFKTFNLANFWIFGWASIGIAFVSSDMVKLFFGDAFVLENSIPLLFAINLFLVGMNSAVYVYQTTMGLFRYGQYLILLTAGLNLLLDVLLGRRFGLVGIYLATVFARFFTNVWYEPWMVFKHGFHLPPWAYFKKYGIFLLAMVIDAVLCQLACSLVHFNTLSNVLIKMLICSIIPNGVLIAFFYRTDEYKHLRESISRLMARLTKSVFKKTN